MEYSLFQITCLFCLKWINHCRFKEVKRLNDLDDTYVIHMKLSKPENNHIPTIQTSTIANLPSPIRFKKLLLSSVVITAFGITQAQASGFLLQEAVVANAGTAGAGDGVYTESAAAMWANPATMSHMGQSKTTINAMVFDLELDYQDNNGNGNANGHTVMPTLGVFHVTEVNQGVHFGLGLGVVGGSSIEYGDQWAGARLLDNISLMSVQLNPSMSFQIDEQWSVGIGAQLNWASLEQNTAMISTESGSDWAYGYNLGAMYQPNKQWALGLSYRSKLVHKFDLDAQGLIPHPDLGINKVTTGVVVPDIVDFSASFSATQDLNLLTSIQFHRWSHLDNTALSLSSANGRIEPDMSIDREWSDVWHFAIGADYRLNADWRLKAGFSYETSPQDDPSKQWVDLPVGEQYRYSVGLSTMWNDTGVDLFYQYTDLGNVDINRLHLDGRFDGRIHYLGANFTF
jgi:long-subunit fatty acid transport protein